MLFSFDSSSSALYFLGYRRISLAFILHCVFKFDNHVFHLKVSLDYSLFRDRCPLKSQWEYFKGEHFLRMISSLKFLIPFISSLFVSDCSLWRGGFCLSITDIRDRFSLRWYPRQRREEKVYVFCSFILLYWGNSIGTWRIWNVLPKDSHMPGRLTVLSNDQLFSSTIPCARTMMFPISLMTWIFSLGHFSFHSCFRLLLSEIWSSCVSHKCNWPWKIGSPQYNKGSSWCASACDSL